MGLDGSDAKLCQDRDDDFGMADRPRRKIDEVLSK